MDWTHYLQSIRQDDKLSRLREFYTITTVEGKTPQQKALNAAPLLFDFRLMVERVEEKQDQEGQEQERKQVERLGVLDGLRKYAKNHVLLQGKPGSGKSTALKRLLLEEAETDNHIPVLIELKFYEESIVGLIREFLGRHGARLSNAEITEALDNGEFLLLVDGVNELPSEAARRDLETFRSRYQKSTAMIFTTRDLGLGGNLGIEKKLEMLPLSESQMREFVCAYLQDTGEVMLGKLRDRLREFGKTPLLLKMLCDLYVAVGTIPENLGLIFRAFTTQYENHPELKGKVPLGVSSKSFWGDLLQEIAFRMMQGDDDPKEITVAIPKSEAVKVIWNFCEGANLPNSLGDARQWLEELLAYHLIELEGRDQITFCHQLIQEYYAAEKLLKLLPELDNWSLKWNYLNHIKWTETIKLMCSLINHQAESEHIFHLSLEVDYNLAANILRMIPDEFQKNNAQKIIDLPIQDALKRQLITIARSHYFIDYLLKFIASKINSESGKYDFEGDFNLLVSIDRYHDKSKKAILLYLKDKNISRKNHGIGWALGQLAKKDNEIFPIIEKLLDDDYDSFFKSGITSSLLYEGSDNTREFWFSLLSNQNVQIKNIALQSLHYGHRISFKKLNSCFLQKIAHEIRSSWDVLSIQNKSVLLATLGEIDFNNSKYIIINSLNSEEKEIKRHAIWALTHLGNFEDISYMNNLINDTDIDIQIAVSEFLLKHNDHRGIDQLIKLLNSSSLLAQTRAASALQKTKSRKTINPLKKAVKSTHYDVRWRSANSLGKNAPDDSIKELIDLLDDPHFQVRQYAALALGNISKNQEFAIKKLKQILVSDINVNVRRYAVNALIKIGSEKITEILIHSLEDKAIVETLIDGLTTLHVVHSTEKLISLLQSTDMKVFCAAAKGVLKLAPTENNLEIIWNRFEQEKCDLNLYKILQEYQQHFKIYRLQPRIPQTMTDFLIVTALIDEAKAIKSCLDGWIEGIDQNGFAYQQTKFNHFTLTLARPVQMGETHTANLATRLISELKPKAIFMTGICAGNPDKVQLGDVIVASTIFKVDAGKQTPEGFFHDIKTYNLKPQWKPRLEDLQEDKTWYKDIQTSRPKTFTHQKGWFLHTLYNYEAKTDLCPSPADHPDRTIHCPDWQQTIKQLVSDELITLPELRLTPKAIDLIRENRILHLETGFPHDRQSPEVHVGAMATTSSVQEDPELFDRIKKYAGQRNILGVEMEGAAIGAVAEITGIPMLVVKAVQDYGDTHKSDQFRAYSAEASARFLLTFLETIDLEKIS